MTEFPNFIDNATLFLYNEYGFLVTINKEKCA